MGKRGSEVNQTRRSRGTGHVRIEDVARSAQVSAQTVSRFFRDPALVSETTAEKIRLSVASVGYVPNLVAGSLASNRSRIIAILVPTIANPVHASPVQGLADAVRKQGYQVLVGTTDYDRDIEHALVEAFLGRRVDGIVLTGAVLREDTDRLLRRTNIPTVQIWELPDNPIGMAVGHSNTGIGRTMAQHLLSRGYSRLAVVGHAARTDTRSAARVAGFNEVVRAAGLPEPVLIEVERPNALAQTPKLLERLLAHRPKLQGVFCVTDQIAIGLILASQRAGVSVPKRLAIAGVTDSDLAALVTPALTTVRIPRYELGHTAGTMLLARLSGQWPTPAVADLGFELIVREST
jgi:LacI family transcriptional regulator, gluconate utilization system Gnt-I transcriptional repressor